MDKQEVKKRIEHLKKLIEHYRYAYHVLDKSLISDEALDSLKKELFDLEQQFPEFVAPDSPTQRVGGKPLKEFKKVRHEAPMISFNDAFSEQDMIDWLTRLENYLGYKITGEEEVSFRSAARGASGHDSEVRRLTDEESERRKPVSERAGRTSGSLEKKPTTFFCELKIDGLAIEFVYDDGILVQASTRGDGLIGEDITQNIKTIEAVPLRLESSNPKYKLPKHIVVRGEVFLSKKEFERINKEQEKKGEKIYANPRNIAAGSVRQLDPKIIAGRKLDSFQYDIIGDLGLKYHEQEHEALKSFGCKINPHNKAVATLKEVFEFRNYWEKHREKLDYEIDGIVVIVNDNREYANGGVIGKAPRSAIAYKFSPREATTIIEDIKLQVGRTGVLTPVAELKPVEVGGITITHATLHNYDEIQRLGVKIGDTVIVNRAGDVIPKVTKVLKELRTGKEKEFKMPAVCPVDGSKVIKDGVAYRCGNKNCGARQREFLDHVAAIFEIDGLGPKIIDRFLDEGLIIDAPDIFTIKEGDIKSLERFGEKSAQNIVEEIQSKKKILLPRFISALGILHIGEETGILLSEMMERELGKVKKTIEVWNFFNKISLEKLQGVHDIGPKVAQSIHDYFHDQRHKELIKKFEQVGIEIVMPARVKNAKLKGKSFVLTGMLESMSREQAKEKIRSLGGEPSESVSKKTSFVVAGNEPGSKYEKAKKLGIKIINEKEFLKLINN